MLKAKILESFQSIQGEGPYAGVSQVFVRFFECNMHCSWCDTPHSIGDTTRKFDEFSSKELLDKTKELWSDCHSVSITGGEPLIQVEFLKEYLPLLKENQMAVYLETNGIYAENYEEIKQYIDVVSMDMKLPSSTKCQDYWQEHRGFLKASLDQELFIKAVITSDTTDEDVLTSVKIVKDERPDSLFILQPNSFELSNGVVKRCQDLLSLCQTHLNDVRLLPQVHRMLKLR